MAVTDDLHILSAPFSSITLGTDFSSFVFRAVQLMNDSHGNLFFY